MLNYTLMHYSQNVMDLDGMVRFYEDAFGLRVVRRVDSPDGAFRLAFLGCAGSDMQLELMWFKNWKKDGYDLGDNRQHVGLYVDDYPAAHKRHEELGILRADDPARPKHFIKDPEGHWLEILPRR